MSTPENVLHVDRRLRFSTPDGDPLPTETVWFRATDPPSARVLLRWKDWERVVREGLFRLGEGSVPQNLVPDNEVVIELRLDGDADLSYPTDEPTLRSRLADPSDPLQSSTSWVGTDVTQRGPLPTEEELTDSVFDENDSPRAHVGELTFEQVPDGVRRVDTDEQRGADADSQSRGDDVATRRGTAAGTRGTHTSSPAVETVGGTTEYASATGGDTSAGGAGGVTDDLHTTSGAVDAREFGVETTLDEADAGEAGETATGEADAGETATGETVTSEADETRGGAGTAAVAPEIASVAAAFDDEGWPYEVRADSDRLELAVTLGDREWRAVVEPGDRDGWCTITSVFPNRVPAARRGEVATRLLGVSESLSRGSFSLDEETGRLAFRTPFVPASEPVRDAVGEHVTTVAEWLDELPS